MEEIRQNIIRILRQIGYIVEERSMFKNGLEKNAIDVRENTDTATGAIIYIDDLIREMVSHNFTPEKIVDKLLEVTRDSMKIKPNIDGLFSIENVKKSARVGVQRILPPYKGEVKRPTEFDGIEEYVYLRFDDEGISGSIRLTEKHLEIIGITAEEVFKYGHENNHNEVRFIPIWDMLSELIEMPPFFFVDTPPIYVMTNNKQICGAAAMLDKKAITELSRQEGIYKWTVIPSSRHEVIIFPAEGIEGMESLDYIKDMVKEVNYTSVAPEDVLVDDAFEITVDAAYMNDAA